LAQLTLSRDGQATPPGPSASFWFGERTHYRDSAWVADRFSEGLIRYEPWIDPPGFGALSLVGTDLTITTLNIEGLAIRDTVLTDKAQWAELTIGALLSPSVGGYASVGIVLRGSPPFGLGNAYLVTAVAIAGVARTRISRVMGGAITQLAEALTPWRAGERLRASVDGGVISAFRQGTLILQHQDNPSLWVVGRIGLEAKRVLADDQASIREWVGGQRTEYNGVIVDVGDVSRGLGMIDPTGEPASWDLIISNLQRIGDAPRFANLIRQGTNTQGYDLLRAPVRITTALRDAPVPLVVARGHVNEIASLDDLAVKLVCGGPDSHLEPDIDGVQVNHIPGPTPTGPPAEPLDPCADPGPPNVEAGSPPTEPEAPTPPEEPEAPPAVDDGGADDDETPPLVEILGFFLIFAQKNGSLWDTQLIDINNFDTIQALEDGYDIDDLPTSLNDGSPFGPGLHAQGHHIGEVRGKVSNTGFEVQHTKHVWLYRSPVTVPGTKLKLACRNLRQEIHCETCGFSFCPFNNGMEWLGPFNVTSLILMPFIGTGVWKGETGILGSGPPPVVPGRFYQSQAHTSLKIVAYAPPNDLGDLTSLDLEDNRPEIIAILGDLPVPAPGAPLNAMGDFSGGTQCGPHLPGGWPDPTDYIFVEIDIGTHRLIGIEYDVITHEDPITHEITFEPVDAPMPEFIGNSFHPDYGHQRHALNSYAFELMRLWTPES
jgi:hypothetical protein